MLDIETRFILHYGLHFLFPGIIAYIFFRDQWKKVWVLFIATMLVDIDHLFATPMYDSMRCSIGFHPLHSYPSIVLYTIGLLFPRTRIIALGLIFHMITDYLDCVWII